MGFPSNYPKHLIENHPEKIYINPIHETHYIEGYVKHNWKSNKFCACLTCKKGVIGCALIGGSWIRKHAKETECETNHATMLEEFKKICNPDTPPFYAFDGLYAADPLELKSIKKPEPDTSKRKTSPEGDVATDDIGYVYCLSNASMPGIFKVGMTRRSPEARAAELFTTGVSVPFVIEFAKRVTNPVGKERIIHRLLLAERLNSRREFFRTSYDTIRDIFDLMGGESWTKVDD